MNLPHIPFLKIFFFILILGVIVWIGGIFFDLAKNTPLSYDSQSLVASVTVPAKETPNQSTPTKSTDISPQKKDTPPPPLAESAPLAHEPATPQQNIEIPQKTGRETYPFPPIPFEIIHTAAAPTIVNILCVPKNGASHTGATGTGVIIDPRGIVLTNAHIAQYLVLKDYPTQGSIRCVLRTGSPAQNTFYAKVLFFPTAWAQEHGGEYDNPFARGTGEHDWALLYITQDAREQDTPLPFMTPDVRERISALGDSLFITGYPAGFLDSETIVRALWPVSTIAQIKTLFTFHEGTPDLMSVGGTIVAQGGISGSPAINAWGRLVGIAVTASEGGTTDERDLRFVSLFHINESIKQETGMELAEFISGDIKKQSQFFLEETGGTLVQLLTTE